MRYLVALVLLLALSPARATGGPPGIGWQQVNAPPGSNVSLPAVPGASYQFWWYAHDSMLCADPPGWFDTLREEYRDGVAGERAGITWGWCYVEWGGETQIDARQELWYRLRYSDATCGGAGCGSSGGGGTVGGSVTLTPGSIETAIAAEWWAWGFSMVIGCYLAAWGCGVLINMFQTRR